jgi:hypothetical protein
VDDTSMGSVHLPRPENPAGVFQIKFSFFFINVIPFTTYKGKKVLHIKVPAMGGRKY